MPNLSIKDVPEALAEQLRQRAARNHRSLQGELMALLEAALQTTHHQAQEPAARAYAVVAPAARPAMPIPVSSATDKDDLLARLDGIVADSQWGKGPWLTREQIHDRRLMRELEFEQRQAEAAA